MEGNLSSYGSVNMGYEWENAIKKGGKKGKQERLPQKFKVYQDETKNKCLTNQLYQIVFSWKNPTNSDFKEYPITQALSPNYRLKCSLP